MDCARLGSSVRRNPEHTLRVRDLVQPQHRPHRSHLPVPRDRHSPRLRCQLGSRISVQEKCRKARTRGEALRRDVRRRLLRCGLLYLCLDVLQSFQPRGTSDWHLGHNIRDLYYLFEVSTLATDNAVVLATTDRHPRPS